MPSVDVIKLHLSDRNRPAKIIDQIVELATAQSVDISYHSSAQLSRISKNAKQDQGVALDLRCQNFQSLDDFLKSPRESNKVIALDRVTNPQNLGMIIRSVAASPTAAILIPTKGCAPLNSMVIKASAGALFKAPIVQVEDLHSSLVKCQTQGFNVASLEIGAPVSIFDYTSDTPTVFVLGNETDGVSSGTANLCDVSLHIPMERGVESLNVAVTASLIAFLS